MKERGKYSLNAWSVLGHYTRYLTNCSDFRALLGQSQGLLTHNILELERISQIIYYVMNVPIMRFL